MKILFSFLSALLLLVCGADVALAATGEAADYTGHWAGYAAVAVFVLAYIFVIFEETVHLRKSKPVMVAAGIIWMIVAYVYNVHDRSEETAGILRHNLLEYAELTLFLMAAMTYINTLSDRNVFQALRSWLVSRGFSYRKLYWILGTFAFFMSPIADNLTTALVLGAVALAVGAGNAAFISVACINVVVAANSGGAFSPFGDITTLMVWQKGLVTFFEFFELFTPSLVSWLVPAVLMSFAIKGDGKPTEMKEAVTVKYGGYVITAMFLGTIALTVTLHQVFHLPPFLGMMTGLGFLKLYGYFVRKAELKTWEGFPAVPDSSLKPARKPFDIFISMKRVEWDTLMFFYGIILCVGGLGALGYLSTLAQFFYIDLGTTYANILVGILSAIIDNIPVMFAVLSMNPDMTHNQWLLVTLTAGIGGSMLSIGSAAGVALMGQARGIYTFFSHLKWSWAIALGYAAGIATHIWLNGLGPAG